MITVRHRKAALRAQAAGVALACALAATMADATLYKWTDANGRVVYSDQAPAGNVKYEIVGGAAPPDNPNAARDMATKDTELRLKQRERVEDAKKAEKAEADAARRADICRQARAAVRMYQNEYELLHYYNERGEKLIMDDAERRRRLADQQKVAKDHCPAG